MADKFFRYGIQLLDKNDETEKSSNFFLLESEKVVFLLTQYLHITLRFIKIGVSNKKNN